VIGRREHGGDLPFGVVLTHHPRPPLPMQGGTTFTFVTDDIESALDQAMRAAGGKDVVLAGGASTAQQYLAARLIDEVNIALVPLLLGGVTHLKHRVVK